MIEKRAYLSLSRQFDECHPTVSAIAPLLCFVAIFTVLILLRLIEIFGVLTATCVATDQFWYTTSAGNWPLVGSSLLIMFLLFVWNIAIAIDDWSRSIGTKILIVVNAVSITAILFFFTAIHDSAMFAHNARAGVYDDIKFQPYILLPMRTEPACATMQRFAGRWRVVDRRIGHYGFDFPAQWIELKPWGYVWAQDTDWSQPYAERWSAPYQLRDSDDKRWRWGDLFSAPWDFDLQGDTLVLTTPDEVEHEWQRSRITLQRESIPSNPVFPNPHAARP